jgi:DNA polymerase (family 10)
VTAPRRSTITLGRGFPIVQTVEKQLEQIAPYPSLVSRAGGLRRAEPLVDALQIVVATDEPHLLIDALPRLEAVEEVLHLAGEGTTVVADGEQVEIICVAPDAYAMALLHHTGSSGHVAQLHVRAAELGLELTPASLVERARAARRPIESEADAYEALGLQYIPPELRHGHDEVRAAARHELPRLVERLDIRGDLHMHTTWSDGRDSIETMVRTARQLGYEYVAITDHSPNSGAARAMNQEQAAQQIVEIDHVRRLVPDITILHGAEVDILPDGGLDLPEALLERLDIVLASLHHAAGQDPEALTRRVLTAIEHPLVNVITHPANQIVGRREGYPLDFDRIFAAAADTGTFLEVDGAPLHLDLDGALARRAVAAGALLAVDSDCHRAEWLERQMGFGIATARRGWVPPEAVVNARGLDDLLRLLRRKRTRQVNG